MFFMDKEAFARLFLFDKALSSHDKIQDPRASLEDWETEWDTDIKNQLQGLKNEIELLKEVKKRSNNDNDNK